MTLAKFCVLYVVLFFALASCKTVEPVVVVAPPTNLEKINSEINQTSIRAHLEFLASDALKGSCLLYTSPSPRDLSTSRMPSSA